MRNATAILLLILMMIAAGCQQRQQIDAKYVKVTYVSDPPGGTLYKQNGELWGDCPKVLLYDIDKEAIKNGYIEAEGLIVRWPGGPERRSADTIRIKVNGTDRRVIFKQPRSPVVGREIESFNSLSEL